MSAVAALRRVPGADAGKEPVEALAAQLLDAPTVALAQESALAERQVRTVHVEKLVRVSCHVPPATHLQARRGAALLNMSIDAFMAACLRDGLTKLGL